jgi:hypothetical protein
MEAAGCSETYVPICHTTEHHTSEDSYLHIHHPENLQSHYKQDLVHFKNSGGPYHMSGTQLKLMQ